MVVNYDFLETAKDELFLLDIYQNNLGYSRKDAFLAVTSTINQDFI